LSSLYFFSVLSSPSPTFLTTSLTTSILTTHWKVYYTNFTSYPNLSYPPAIPDNITFPSMTELQTCKLQSLNKDKMSNPKVNTHTNHYATKTTKWQELPHNSQCMNNECQWLNYLSKDNN
jgi:hypothetical protein